MSKTVFNGLLLDQHTSLTLNDLSQACSCSTDWIMELVEEGVIEPPKYSQTQWCFGGESLSRVLVAMRLQRDLDINLAGIALSLDLLDEIKRLKSQLDCCNAHQHSLM